MLEMLRPSFHQLLRLGIVALLFVSVSNAAFGFQDEFEVGDAVEFNFMGEKRQGKITGFTGTGWPRVEFEYRGKTTERPRPPSQLILAQKNDSNDTATSHEMRTWTDKTGAFTIKAKLLSHHGGNVELEKADGRVVTLPETKLCDADRKHLKTLTLQDSADNPFAGGKPKTGSKPEKPATTKTLTAIAVKTDANEILLSDNGWNVALDTAVVTEPNGKIIRVDSKSKKHKFYNKLSSVVLTADNRLAASTIGNPFESKSKIAVLDLESGKGELVAEIPLKQASIMAISPDGNVAVSRSKESLDFWELQKDGQQLASWKIASFSDRSGFAPTSGRFLDQSRLLTFGRRIVLWDLKTAESIYAIAVSNLPAVSANGKQIAVAAGNSVYIVDSENGKSLGKFEAPLAANMLAFSASGQFLAGINKSNGDIWIWDLSSNTLAQRLSAPISMVNSMIWAGEKHLLVNDSHLIDIELRTTVWQYNVSGGSVAAGSDGRFWYVSKTTMTPISIPHMNLDDKTAEFDPDDLLVLKPGSEVSIDIKISLPLAERESIRKQLTKMLQANDCTVTNGAALKLKVSSSKGKSESVEMSSFTDPFGRRGTESVNYSPTNVLVALTKNNVELWTKKRQFGPGHVIQMREGESAQQAANRLCQPDPNFFKSIKLPMYISKFSSGKPLGVSTFTGK